MKIANHLFLFVAATTLMMTAARAEFSIEALDLKELARIQPPNWKIQFIRMVEAPGGWQRANGGRGIHIFIQDRTRPLQRAKDMLPDPIFGMSARDFPSWWFTIMPLDWSGSNKLGGKFAAGKFEPPKFDRAGGNPDDFVKACSSFFVFMEEGKRISPELETWFESIKFDQPEP